ncbi:MAG: LOG family protein [Leptospiraceae bacterium]|nr:LOG family protein [Leptospiraceae bacterium]
MLLGLALLVGCHDPDALQITLRASDCDHPGRKVPDGELPTPTDVATDVYCAQVVTRRSAPKGFVTIFGSARARPGMISYELTREFAATWTKKYGQRYPILTGGGPGIMEAGNKGAKEAGGPSLGFSTYFGKGNEPLNAFTTDGYVFASFAQREADMIDGAVALIAAPGGVGTEWEIFESLAKIQTHKKSYAPLILLGPDMMWESLFKRIEALKAMKTISADDDQLLLRARTAAEAVQIIEQRLQLNEKSALEKAS